MSDLGLVAVVLASACLVVLVHDLWQRRTAFAQFAAARAKQPFVFWMGIAGWVACLAGGLLVAMADYGRQLCTGQNPCTITAEGAQL